jgi:TIR domain
MKIFVSHASEDKAAAESITFSLRNRGHVVFLDRDDLPAGNTYDQRIENAIKDSELFIFLISPSSLAQGRYTLTELALARRKWPNPNRHILPIMTVKTPFNVIPEYLKAVTILEPQGNITPETSAAVDALASAPETSAAVDALASATLWSFLANPKNQKTLSWLGGGAVVVIAGLWAAFVYFLPLKKEADSLGPQVTIDSSVKAGNCGIANSGTLSNSPVSCGTPPPATGTKP